MHYKKYKTVLSPTNGMNLYRGCSHGCIYCDSRSKCYQMDHEFEDIEVKEDAINLLEEQLKKKRNPVMIGTGAMTDPYLHLESSLRLTRKALEIIYKYNCGISILTKSNRILEDIDLIDKINQKSKAVVQVTLTTADNDLCKILEPNVSTTKEREKILEECNKRNIRTIVWLCPILPFINDSKENLIDLLDICSRNNVYGIINFGFGLTLRDGNREYFYENLDKYFPGLKEKYIRVYGNKYECSTPNARYLNKVFIEECQKRNIVIGNDNVFKFLSEYPKNEQLSLFDF